MHPSPRTSALARLTGPIAQALRLLLAVLAMGSAIPARAASGLRFGPEPGWIDEAAGTAVEKSLATGDATAKSPGGLDYLLIEQQANLAEPATYYRTVYRIADTDGLQDGAVFSADYDPAYQTMEVHHVRLIRDGRSEDRLDPEGFETMRLERDRELYMYDGRLTAELQLSDVRVGDVIDYAYTLRGENPVFGGRYSDFYDLAWSVPVRRAHYELFVPAGRSVTIKTLGGEAPEPARARVDGGERLSWDLTSVAAVDTDADTPDWVLGYPTVHVSEFPTWKDVVQWALPLYAPPRELDPTLAAQLDKLVAGIPDTEARVRAVLAFVQEDVRYLGIELGPGSHQPRPPGQTLASRFGDCKDKSLLLCTLLRGLGIEAWPALVSTDMGPALDTWPASPLAFDHVISWVALPGKAPLWLDATSTHEAGPLEQHAAPDYGWALVLRPGTEGLQQMQVPPEAEPRMEEKSVFTSVGFGAPASLSVTTRYFGQSAQDMRAYFADATAGTVTRDDVNYYTSSYPKITAARDTTWNDDPATNVFTVEENYSIPDFWQRDDDGTYHADVSALALHDDLAAPSAPVRKQPLAVDHPVNRTVDIEVHLHADWNARDFDHQSGDEAFAFDASGHSLGPREYGLHYTYRSLRDHVAAEKAGAHAAALARARENSGYSFTYDPSGRPRGGDGGSGTRDIVVIAALAIVMLVVLGLRRSTRHTHPFAH